MLHKCDNPGCVRPEHLFLGTNADNVADKMRKGRFNNERALPLGENHKNAKLTEYGVRYIITDPLPRTSRRRAELGEMFGISASVVWYVQKRKGWRHVEPCYQPVCCAGVP